MDRPFCTNCKHCSWNDFPQTGGFYTKQTVICRRIPPVEQVCLLLGDKSLKWALLCWKERKGIKDELGLGGEPCGPEGRYFQQMEKRSENS